MKKILSGALAFLLAVSAMSFASCGKDDKKSGEFDESNIVLSFSAMSDIHQQVGQEKVKDKLVRALDYAEELAGGTLDVALFAGDLTEDTWKKTGLKDQPDYTTEYNADIAMLKTAIEEGIDVNETGVFYCLGNHDTDPSVLGDVMTEMPALFYSQLGEEFFRIDTADSEPAEGRRHAVVNGYHFLSVNPARYWTLNGYEKSTLDWLDEKLSTITKESPDRYVFVTAHPPVYETVNGSCATTWGDADIAAVISKYPQVVYFSGHIHNVLQDETQISQNGAFTALDCGSVKYTGWMNNVNDNLIKFDNDVGTRIDDFSEGLLVQADVNGNLRVQRCDYVTKNVIKDAWELSYPQSDGSHLKKYDNESRKANNAAPVFASSSALTVTASGNDVSCVWQAATDDDMVRYYTLTVYNVNDTKKTKVKTFYLGTFTYRYDRVEDMPESESWKFTIDDMKKYCETYKTEYTGEYYFELRAVDVWFARSEVITASFPAAE